ncbi:hypothetical protein [Ferribacterium limneticum]|uniref:hypothetical protein n=1 Tax=Ferribacterium limneticum TaxID=76259 RepID=UPI001CF8BC0B|nr:hypothetical protein [Ferribacterium limneticum]UCV22645.1 hypothetical protein KI613_19370 [Ferribacterium limneticum]
MGTAFHRECARGRLCLIGAALSSPVLGADEVSVPLWNADQALDKAKRPGKNANILFTHARQGREGLAVSVRLASG